MALLPPSVSPTRTALLRELIVSLAGADPPLRLSDRSVAEPTVALLDAWATAHHVLGFYLDRFAAEGYIGSAVQPGSILALAGLLGIRPRPGIASTLTLTYTLNPDPADTATVLPAGLLSQSVPGAGETPQSFETSADLVARPSWNTLAPKTTQPLTLDPTQAADLSRLVVAGVTNQISANDRIVLQLAGGSLVPLTVVSAATDLTGMVTNVALRPPPAVAPAPVVASVESAIDGLLSELSSVPPPAPASVNQLKRTPGEVFGPGADVTPRLLAALRPEVAASLYSAMANTALGVAPATGASVMRAKATPFGATAQPRQLTDAQGNPAGTEELALGLTHELEFEIDGGLAQTAVDGLGATTPPTFATVFRQVSDEVTPGQVRLSCTVGSTTAQATFVSGQGAVELTSVDGTGLGSVAVSLDDGVGAVVLNYTPDTADPQPPQPFSVTLSWETSALAVLVTIESGGRSSSYVWDPTVTDPIRVDLGAQRLSISWPVSTQLRHERAPLKVTIETPLPVDPTVLTLNAVYATIVTGSTVLVQWADGSRTEVIATVTNLATVQHTAFGMTQQVTQLGLDKPWLMDTDLLLSAVRPANVYAAPAPLVLQPVPIPGDIAGSSIDLAGVVAGIDAGRLILVTGTRTDLPAGATVRSGELVMVQSVSHGAGAAAAGDTPFSTLELAPPGLTYSYARDSVTIHANVVVAHQGATTTEVLGSGVPSAAPQTFTVSGSPILADAAATGTGSVSTLAVSVDGVPSVEVARANATTPPNCFVAGADAQGRTTVTFPALLPPGTGNVVATYRSGDGAVGNVRAHQVSQLLSRPLGVSAVDNPLAASGGSGADDPTALLGAVAAGVGGLGRLVTVQDYAALAGSWAGVAQATARVAAPPAAMLSIVAPSATVSAAAPRGESLVVTVAGSRPAPLDPAGTICSGLAAAFAAAGDPLLPVLVVPAGLWMIVLAATVTHDSASAWDDVAGAVRASLLAAFGYPARRLGAAVALGDLAGAAHTAPGVLAFSVTSLALVPSGAGATDLAVGLPKLLAVTPPSVLTAADAAGRWAGIAKEWAPSPDQLAADQIAYLSDAVPDTLILTGQVP